MNIFRLAGDMSHVFSIIILFLRLKVAKNANGACKAARCNVQCSAFVDRLNRSIVWMDCWVTRGHVAAGAIDRCPGLLFDGAIGGTHGTRTRVLPSFFALSTLSRLTTRPAVTPPPTLTPGVSLKTQELFLIVFCCRYLDLFFRFISLYNSLMKMLYIAATAAIVHMIRCKEPYKSTYDRTQDSFRLEFAVVPCAVLALLTNLVRGFGLIEVRAKGGRTTGRAVWRVSSLSLLDWHTHRPPRPPTPTTAAMDLLHLPGGGGHPPAAHRPAALLHGGEPHGPLRLLPRRLPRPLHPQLGKLGRKEGRKQCLHAALPPLLPSSLSACLSQSRYA